MFFRNCILNYPLILFFITVLVSPSLLNIVADVDTSYIRIFEKRNPEPFPGWEKHSNVSIQFEKFFSDHLWGRYHLLRALAEVKYAMNTSLNPDRVLIGKNGWLYIRTHEIESRYRNLSFFKSKENNTPESFAAKMVELQKWCLAQGTTLVLSMPPLKHNVYPEFLPRWFNLKADAPNAMETLTSELRETGVNYVDLREVLITGKKTGRLYLSLDTHWTRLGALLAFHAITQEAYRLLQRPWHPIQFSFHETIGGDKNLAAMIYMNRLLQVDIDIKTTLPLNTYDLYKDGEIYRRSCLDEIKNRDVPMEAVNPESPDAPTAVWLRDSFGAAATPFLMQYFSRVLAYDYRTGGAYSKSPLRIDELVRAHKPDVLLITANEDRGFDDLGAMLNVSLPYFFDFVPMNLNHGVWIKGVDKDRACFVVRKTPKNDVALKEGAIIEFASSGQRRVLRRNITPDGDYLIVFVEGDALDPESDGWPTIFKVSY